MKDQFTAVSLDGDAQERLKKKIKVPRRILHFSDGTLEEYSTDEEDETDDNKKVIDPVNIYFNWASCGENKIRKQFHSLYFSKIGKIYFKVIL